MTEDEQVAELLGSIDRRLALLTAGPEREMRDAFNKEVLRSDARALMFKYIDGHRGAAEIAKATNLSLRTVQTFFKDLLDAGFAFETQRGSGRAIVVRLDESAILRWYLDRPTNK